LIGITEEKRLPITFKMVKDEHAENKSAYYLKMVKTSMHKDKPVNYL